MRHVLSLARTSGICPVPFPCFVHWSFFRFHLARLFFGAFTGADCAYAPLGYDYVNVGLSAAKFAALSWLTHKLSLSISQEGHHAPHWWGFTYGWSLFIVACMAIKTAQQASAKWLAGMQNSQQTMQDGVNAVTVAPGTAAANAKQKWILAMTSQKVQDKWARNVAIGGSLSNWQGAMNTYGISRAIQGAQQKESKYTAAITSVLAYEATLQAQIKAMPSVTPQDRINRMLAWVNGMANYQRPAT